MVEQCYSGGMEDEAEQPTEKWDIHGHAVLIEDDETRRYLKKLDYAEAKAIFDYAKSRGRTDFEVTRGHTRYNYNMTYHNGIYTVVEEGRQ